MRKLIKENPIVGGLVLVVIGIWFFITGIEDWKNLSGELQDFNAMQVSECKPGKYVQGEVYGVLDYFCSIKEGSVEESRYYFDLFWRRSRPCCWT